MSRIATIDPENLSPDQQRAFDQIAGGKRGRVGPRGPFALLLHSPGLASCVERVGVYLRYESPLPTHIKETAILVVSRHWFCDVEWRGHSGHALAAGVPQEVVDAIGDGKEPQLSGDERAAYDFVRAVLKVDGMSRIPDPVFTAAYDAFGEAGLMDLAGLAGYYSLLAKVMNTFELRPEGADIPWRRSAAE